VLLLREILLLVTTKPTPSLFFTQKKLRHPNLEAAGKIYTDPPADKRPKRLGAVTFSDNVVVTFPRREHT
jgi:hypothetical protein